MRMSKLFGRTLRQVEERGSTGLKLLARAGFLRREPFSILPLGSLALEKLKSLWEKVLAPEFQRIELTFCEPLSPEEKLLLLVSKELASYRELPLYLESEVYLSKTSPFYLPEGKAYLLLGLLPDEGSAREQWQALSEKAERLIKSCKLHSPFPGFGKGWDWIVPDPEGEERVVVCPGCGYSAPPAWARVHIEPLPPEELEPPREVATPNCTTIESLASFLGVPRSKTAKAVFYTGEDERIVFAVIRGDMEVSEAKLSSELGWVTLRPSTEGELLFAGIVPGYASPIGVKGVTVAVDSSLRSGANFVAGANREGYHLIGVNYPRDFQANLEGDLALARAGDRCPFCQAVFEEARGFLVASLRMAGPEGTSRRGLSFNTPERRKDHPWAILMVLYPYRFLEAVAQLNHDEKGLLWPEPLAPFHVHLIGLGEEGLTEGESFYLRLKTEGIAVLFDDRDESAGVKFTDADLIGLPWRVVVSKRSLSQGGVEVRRRTESLSRVVPFDVFLREVQSGNQ
ncbi:MAG: YbaK/EbsC family protein [Anaerolineae bacterium]|nr:His/Gly/Thr/Pro-type tRNA ligase C-terminal domain-containing protein [Anaerolineae bacterium]MDW8101316.1 YbaK/EbsC family protein [Anaerolineae bacterium]